MTTIAASKKYKTIACDRQYTYNDSIKMQGDTKIIELPESFLKTYFNSSKGFMGFSGSPLYWSDVVSWILTQEGKPPKCKNIDFLVLTDQSIYHSHSVTSWMEIPDTHWAIGSGYTFALSAMDLDKTPVEAVEFASNRDTYTGMGVRAYEL